MFSRVKGQLLLYIEWIVFNVLWLATRLSLWLEPDMTKVQVT